MIADDVIERVRLAADIVQIIGEYVPLRKPGVKPPANARSISPKDTESTTAPCRFMRRRMCVLELAF